MFEKIKNSFKEKKSGWVTAGIIILASAAGIGGTLGTQAIQRKRAEAKIETPKRK